MSPVISVILVASVLSFLEGARPSTPAKKVMTITKGDVYIISVRRRIGLFGNIPYKITDEPHTYINVDNV